MLFSKTIALVYSWLSLLTTSNVQLRLATCNGLRNPENFCLWNPECGKICLWNPEPGRFYLWNLDSWVLESGIPLSIGIRNPEAKFYWQILESSNCNPESTTWSPESKTVLDSLTWGDTGAVKEWWQTAVLSQAVRKQLSQTVLMISSKPLSFFQPPRPPLSVNQANFAVAAAPPALMTVKFVINTQIAPTGRMKRNAVSTKELGN